MENSKRPEESGHICFTRYSIFSSPSFSPIINPKCNCQIYAYSYAKNAFFIAIKITIISVLNKKEHRGFAAQFVL